MGQTNWQCLHEHRHMQRQVQEIKELLCVYNAMDSWHVRADKTPAWDESFCTARMSSCNFKGIKRQAESNLMGMEKT